LSLHRPIPLALVERERRIIGERTRLALQADVMREMDIP
jgi:hypothetical protein